MQVRDDLSDMMSVAVRMHDADYWTAWAVWYGWVKQQWWARQAAWIKRGRATGREWRRLLTRDRMDWMDDVTHKSGEAALTSHFDSGKVSPGFSSPAGLVGDWGSAGGMGIGIGRGMGWLWPSGLSGPTLDVGWPMITVKPVGLEHENMTSCSSRACSIKSLAC